MGIEFAWHPWRALRVRYPDVEVSCYATLPDRLMGLQQGESIWLCRSLTQVERRCTLTHELVHRERGTVPRGRVAAEREERIVNEITARRLIPVSSLIDGLRWTRDPDQLAEHLWVDLPTLRARMTTLDPVEVAELENRLDGEWLWIP